MFKKITALMLLLAAVAAFAIGCGEKKVDEAADKVEDAADAPAK